MAQEAGRSKQKTNVLEIPTSILEVLHVLKDKVPQTSLTEETLTRLQDEWTSLVANRDYGEVEEIHEFETDAGIENYLG